MDADVETLCRNIKQPGGVAAAPAGGANLGHIISQRAQKNINLVAYWLHHSEDISRSRQPADITVVNIHSIHALRDAEDNYENATPPAIDDKGWPRTMDALHEYFPNMYGIAKIPLLYVVHEQETPMDKLEGYWEDPLMQMIDWAPHWILAAGGVGAIRHPNYVVDNKMVFDKLTEICHMHGCWTNIKPFLYQRDGWSAFLALVNHYLGPNNVDNMAVQAEQKLMNTTYHGETRRWNFEHYVTVHQEQHMILERLVQHGHAGIDGCSKTWYLMSSIKTNALDSIKTQILADMTLRNDFSRCMVLYKDYIKQNKANKNPDLNISAVWIECEGSKDNKRKGVTVEDRYYMTKEYCALSNDQKLKLKEIHEAKGHQPNKRQCTDMKKSQKSQGAAIARQLSAWRTKENSEEAAEEQSGNNTNNNDTNHANAQATGNCDHPALTWQNWWLTPMFRVSTLLSLQGDCDTELDSHADTCVLGKNALLFMDHEHPVNVVGYDKSHGTQHRNLPTISGLLAYWPK